MVMDSYGYLYYRPNKYGEPRLTPQQFKKRKDRAKNGAPRRYRECYRFRHMTWYQRFAMQHGVYGLKDLIWESQQTLKSLRALLHAELRTRSKERLAYIRDMIDEEQNILLRKRYALHLYKKERGLC